MKRDIRDLTFRELEGEIIRMGEGAHRARQIFLWINRKGAGTFSVMTDLPKSLIKKLEKWFVVGGAECVKRVRSKDGTEKFLWRLKDGKHIESVLIKEKNRHTVCVSTQVGCRFRCPFCASGTRGFFRDLTVSEIVGQVTETAKLCGLRVTNVVFMGMGEPLDNYDNLVNAVRTINNPEGPGIGARKITVSTCGIVPGIRKLKELGLQVELSVSLHAVYDSLRDELVPVNKKYPLKELLSACREYYEETGREVTLEYTVIEGKNDSAREAATLAAIARGLNAKINLIKCSETGGEPGRVTGRESIRLFRERLLAKRAKVTIRKSRGADILAACGQLAGKEHEI
ncbi:MAG: 23S rRNA (adenine(2503)-C(2))-methyltransferase RlmN [Candidatus Omnitrophota bacterium]